MRTNLSENLSSISTMNSKIITCVCRLCGNTKLIKIADLGHMAISNAFVYQDQDNFPESIYPLKLYFCPQCFLVQVMENQKREDIFNESYVYFSSVSQSWLLHSSNFVNQITSELSLNKNSNVIEIASNDGYLLQYFNRKSIPCMGIEPTLSTATVARKIGVNTLCEFFNSKLATKLHDNRQHADLIICNNVLAHDPNLNDFVRGLKILLKPNGTITIEFPHLLKMIQNNEFDTIYQEHYSYFSILSLKNLVDTHELSIYKIEKLDTHGGSLRVYLKHNSNTLIRTENSLKSIIQEELAENLDIFKGYSQLQRKIYEVKNEFLEYIYQQKKLGKRIAAFGAAAKGNTFINYCGIKPDIIEYVVDETPIKQGKLLPQSHIPVVSMETLTTNKPDIIIIIPWNFKIEIIEKLNFTKVWGAKLVTYIPKLEII